MKRYAAKRITAVIPYLCKSDQISRTVAMVYTRTRTLGTCSATLFLRVTLRRSPVRGQAAITPDPPAFWRLCTASSKIGIRSACIAAVASRPEDSRRRRISAPP